jgi:hypothetical protein
MIEMTLRSGFSPYKHNRLELRIQAPAAAEQVELPTNRIPTLIFVHESIVPEQLPIITHALTDTVNRVSWSEQIQLATPFHQLPNHLETTTSTSEPFRAAKDIGECNFILFTNDSSKELKREISKSSEFLINAQLIQPTSVIETIDTLNDHIKHLKQKTIVNLTVEIELPDENDTLEALDYIPQLTKTGNTYFANLIDLASEEEKAYAFRVGPSDARVTFQYEDLALARTISGGQHLASYKGS